MAVVLDTNILPRSADLNSLELQVLAAAAQETHEELVLPSMALEEAISARRREIESAYDELTRAHRVVRRFAGISALPEMPIPGELARQYGDELERLFRIAPLPDGAAQEALRREAYRLLPAREGKGARDVAIWLTVLAVHTENADATYFVSGNINDFAGSDGDLAPELRAELAEEHGDLHYCRSLTEVLGRLAAVEDPFVDTAFLAGADEAHSAAIQAIQRPEALAELSVPVGGKVIVRGATYAAGPIFAQPTEVSEARGFAVEDAHLTIAWTRWDFVIPVGTFVLSRPGATQEIHEISCSAALQMLIRVDKDGAVAAETLAVRGVRQAEANIVT